MNQTCHITEPAEELRALALAYIQSKDLSKYEPEQIVSMYNSTLIRMWEHYNRLSNK